MQRFHVDRRFLRARALEGIFRSFQQLSGVAFDDGYCRRLRMIQRLDLRPQLPAIRQPVAQYASDKDRIVESVVSMEDLHERLPDSELEVQARPRKPSAKAQESVSEGLLARIGGTMVPGF